MTKVNPSIPTVPAMLTVPEVKPYHYRVVPGGFRDIDVLEYARMNKEAVLLTGPAGTGKTSLSEHYAGINDLPFVYIDCDSQTIDRSVITGEYVPVGPHEVVFQYGDVATAIQQPSVVLINELSRMPAKGASIFLTLLQERRLKIKQTGEIIKVHDDCLLIADQNIGAEYTGTTKQDKAFMDRFNNKLEFDYDRTIEAQFINSTTLLDFADSIRQARKISDEFTSNVTTRMLKNFQAQARGLNFEYAVHSMLQNFPEDGGEREAIQQRFDINRSKIAEELGVELGNYAK